MKRSLINKTPGLLSAYLFFIWFLIHLSSSSSCSSVLGTVQYNSPPHSVLLSQQALWTQQAVNALLLRICTLLTVVQTLPRGWWLPHPWAVCWIFSLMYNDLTPQQARVWSKLQTSYRIWALNHKPGAAAENRITIQLVDSLEIHPYRKIKHLLLLNDDRKCFHRS